jgi:aminopeptidase N
VHTDGGWQDRPTTLASAETPFDVPEGAPVLLDPYTESWSMTHPDAETVAALKSLLPAMEDDLLRSGAWNAVREALHDAAVDPADVLDLVEASLPVEDPEDGGRRTLAWVMSWVVPLAGGDALARVHAAALAKLAGTAAGSEQQLAALRVAISSSTDPGELRGWLDATPPGIDLDLDLRWRVLVRLATLGATDRAELQAAYDAEPTNRSRIEHTRAVASLPDAEAKAWAWDRFTGKVDVPNYELEAAGAGMWRGGQEALTDRYVERYFADLPAAVSGRSGWVQADVVAFFFPRGAADARTLERARAAVADETLPRAVRRRIADEADLLARRVAVLAAYPRP